MHVHPVLFFEDKSAVNGRLIYVIVTTLSEKKGTKVVTGAVPFQKVNFCPFHELISTF